MNAVMVVNESLALNHPASLLEAQKGFKIQQRIAKRDVKRLDITIFREATLSNEQRFDICFFQPSLNHLEHEF